MLPLSGDLLAQLAVADENLVNNVVQGADQQTHDTGNGEFQQKLTDFSSPNIWISCLLSIIPPFPGAKKPQQLLCTLVGL